MRGLLLDLDGTLYVDQDPVPGGPALLEALRERGLPFRCVTNTTSRSRRGLVERLWSLGYRISPEEIVTPAVAAGRYAAGRGLRRVLALTPEPSLEDLEGLTFVRFEEPCQAVIVGDLGERWDFALLQLAFSRLQAGAELVALSKDRYFQKAGGLTLDAGPFVAALEYASGKPAVVVGKPSREFFRLAAASLELPAGTDPHEIVMVGDDLWSDVRGAQEAGFQGWLVQTGKYREGILAESGVRPDRVLRSVVEVLG
ncbi:MAG TPA: TIGR01458 family HAD-type hydrolase [Gemmatimonadales bacterium]|jgi:HAD superfamily hydrolase (TIGR01458 family)|nr:TIGR01458 family HAD-type hydrolase [Gemmatimonadales bacterium]